MQMEVFREGGACQVYPMRRHMPYIVVCESAPRIRMSPTILDFLNRKYMLHIIDALYEGPKHYNQLIKRFPIGTNTLSERLKSLTKEGIVVRKVWNDLPPSVTYRLTQKGQALAAILKELDAWEEDWKGRHPDPRAVVRLEGESLADTED